MRREFPNIKKLNPEQSASCPRAVEYFELPAMKRGRAIHDVHSRAFYSKVEGRLPNRGIAQLGQPYRFSARVADEGRRISTRCLKTPLIHMQEQWLVTKDCKQEGRVSGRSTLTCIHT
jgi:hypothetical protein